MAWNIGYPVNFATDGDETAQAVYKHIQEIAKIYKHLNSLFEKIMLPPQIIIQGVVNDVDSLPATGEVGENWVVDGVYHVWDGMEWVAMDPPSYADATEETKGMVKLGSVDGVTSDTPSATKVITEYIMKSLLNAYSPDDDGCIPGMIVMWYGMVEDIPRGWAKCDGTNGTPDMRTRFPVAPENYSDWKPNTYSGTNSFKLTVDQLPSHGHSFTGTQHDHSFTGISHDHPFTGTQHTHTIGNHSHSETSHYHSLGGHKHTLGDHIHDIHSRTVENGLHSHILDNTVRMVGIEGTNGTSIRVNHDSNGTYYCLGATSSAHRSFIGTTSESDHYHTINSKTNAAGADSNTGSSDGNTGMGDGGATGMTQPTCSYTIAGGTVGGKVATGTVGLKTAGGSISNTGKGVAIDNRPAYCEVIFIMKLFS